MLKTSFFNPTMFFKNVRRFWPLWATYLVLWLILLPVMMASDIRSHAGQYLASNLAASVCETTVSIGIALSFIFAIIAAMSVFSYMYSSKSAGMLHAMPPGRICLYITNAASGLAFLLIPNLIAFAVSVIVEASNGALIMAPLLDWLYIVSATGFFFFMFASFCAQFTGSLFALPVFYGILNLLVVFIETMIRSVSSLLLFGTVNGSFIAEFLSPIYYFYSVIHTNYDEVGIIGISGTKCLIWYILAGVLLGIAALLIYRRRRVESAGDVVSVRCIRPVFRWGAAFCLGVAMAVLFEDIFSLCHFKYLFAVMVGFTLIWGFVGWFGAKMLLKKTFRVFSGGWKSFACFCAAVILMYSAIEFDVFGVEKKLPAPSKVSSIFLYNTLFDDPAELEAVMDLQRQIIESKAEIESAQQTVETYHFTYAEDENIYFVNCWFEYILKDGSILRRSYDIPVRPSDESDPDSLAYMLDALVNTPEKRVARTSLSNLNSDQLVAATVDFPCDGAWTEVTINGDDALMLANAAIKDIRIGNLVNNEVFSEVPSYTEYGNSLYFTVKDRSSDGFESYSSYVESSNNYTFSFRINSSCENIIVALDELGLLDQAHQLTE